MGTTWRKDSSSKSTVIVYVRCLPSLSRGRGIGADSLCPLLRWPPPLLEALGLLSSTSSLCRWVSRRVRGRRLWKGKCTCHTHMSEAEVQLEGEPCAHSQRTLESQQLPEKQKLSPQQQTSPAKSMHSLTLVAEFEHRGMVLITLKGCEYGRRQDRDTLFEGKKWREEKVFSFQLTLHHQNHPSRLGVSACAMAGSHHHPHRWTVVVFARTERCDDTQNATGWCV